MLKYYKNIRKNQIISLVTGILNVLTMLFSSVLLQKIIDGLMVGNFGLVKENVILMSVFIGTNIIFNYIFQYNFRVLENAGSFELREKYFKDILSNDYIDSKSFDSGDILVSLTGDTVKISDFYATGIVTLIIELVVFITTMGILFYYNFYISIIVLITVFLGVFLSNKTSTKIGEETVKLQGASSRENEQILQSINGMRTIKQLNKEEYFADLYDQKLNESVKYSRSLSKYISQYATIFTLISNSLPLITVVISMYFVLNDLMTIGQMVGIMSISGSLTEPITLIGKIMNQRKVAKRLIDKNQKFQVNKDRDAEHSLDLSVKELSFQSEGYYFGERKILENIGFNIKSPDSYLLKGPSGIGKSTIFDIIMKFLPVQDLEVKIDGTDIDKISNESIYGKILLVDQNTVTINASILENITLGESYDSADLQEVIKVCQIEDLIKDKGEDFLINTKGDNLSGGEKQRISIGRILIRKPKLLLLDEPTSALDTKTAMAFANGLIEYCKKYNIGLFIISHDTELFEDLVNGTVELKG